MIRDVTTVELEVGAFYYVEYGVRTAPPLVLHGMPSDGSAWAGVAAELAARVPGDHPRSARTRRQRPHRQLLTGGDAGGSAPVRGRARPRPVRPLRPLDGRDGRHPIRGAQLNDPDPAWWAELPAITAPTLVIGGGATSPVPQQLLAKLAGPVPDATLVTIVGAGQAVHRNRPAEFLAAVRPFLESIR